MVGVQPCLARVVGLVERALEHLQRFSGQISVHFPSHQVVVPSLSRFWPKAMRAAEQSPSPGGLGEARPPKPAQTGPLRRGHARHLGFYQSSFAGAALLCDAA